TVAMGLDGQGARLGETIDQTGVLLGVAHRNRGNARRFIGDSARLGGAVADKGDELTRISGDANSVIGTAARGEGRLAGFADGLADVSLLAAHGFDERGGQLGQAFRSSERTARIIYAQLGLLGDAVRTGNGLLPLYGELTSLEGPEGKNYIRFQGYLPSDPCGLILGLCGPYGGAAGGGGMAARFFRGGRRSGGGSGGGRFGAGAPARLGDSGRASARAGLLVRLVAFVTVTGMLTVVIGMQIARVDTGGGWRVTATFDDASGLMKGDEVKIAGAPVGRVNEVKVVDGKARVGLTVRDSVSVPADTEAAIRWRDAMGRRGVYLMPGRSERKMRPGAHITRTRSVVDGSALIEQLGPLVRSLDAKEVNTVLVSLSQALDGNAENIDRLIADIDVLAASIAKRRAMLKRMLDDYATVTG